LALDDLAEAHLAFDRSPAHLLDLRLAALRGARATPEALVELVEVASLMRDQEHPRADEALTLLQRAVERPLGLDERIGARWDGQQDRQARDRDARDRAARRAPLEGGRVPRARREDRGEARRALGRGGGRGGDPRPLDGDAGAGGARGVSRALRAAADDGREG